MIPQSDRITRSTAIKLLEKDKILKNIREFRLKKLQYNQLNYNKIYILMEAQCELLTTAGWKLISQIAMNDAIATYNIFTKALVWENPIDIFQLEYDGDVIHYENDDIDIYLTPIEIICSKIPSDNILDFMQNSFYKQSIKNIEEPIFVSKFSYNTNPYKKDFIIDNFSSIINIFNVSTIPKTVIDMNVWLEFIGIYISFGEISYVNGVIIFNLKTINQAICLFKIKNMLQYLPNTPEIEPKSAPIFLVRSEILYNYLKMFGSGPQKRMVNYLLHLDRIQSCLLLSTILYGSTYNDFKYLVNYQTDSPLLADQLQILAINAGCSANIISTKTTTFSNLFINICSSKEICVIISGKVHDLEPRLNINKKIIKHYKGTVYNVLTNNSICLVRRNKKYCWL